MRLPPLRGGRGFFPPCPIRTDSARSSLGIPFKRTVGSCTPSVEGEIDMSNAGLLGERLRNSPASINTASSSTSPAWGSSTRLASTPS